MAWVALLVPAVLGLRSSHLSRSSWDVPLPVERASLPVRDECIKSCAVPDRVSEKLYSFNSYNPWDGKVLQTIADFLDLGARACSSEKTSVGCYYDCMISNGYDGVEKSFGNMLAIPFQSSCYCEACPTGWSALVQATMWKDLLEAGEDVDILASYCSSREGLECLRQASVCSEKASSAQTRLDDILASMSTQAKQAGVSLVPGECPTMPTTATTMAPITVEETTTMAPPETTTMAPTTVEETTTMAPTTMEETTTMAPPETTTMAPTTVEETTTKAPTTVEETTTMAPTTVEETTTKAPTTVETTPPTTSKSEPITLTPTTPKVVVVTTSTTSKSGKSGKSGNSGNSGVKKTTKITTKITAKTQKR